MTAIQSLYIRNIEKNVNAEYIANTFSKNGLAQVSKVYIEPYKYKNYSRAYVEIETWHETEAAYSFIKRLRNLKTEARLVHCDDNWWLVDINKNKSKFASNNRVLTVFSEQNAEDDDTSSTAAVVDPSIVNITDDYDVNEYLREIDVEREEWYEDDSVKVDPVKTQQLRDIVWNFKENNEMKLMEQEEANSAEMEAYLREMDWVRNVLRREVTSDMWDETFWY
jgi:hypothetical protein